MFGLLAAYYIYTLFANKINVENLLDALKLVQKQPLTLIIVLLLMPLNWLIETQKWRLSIVKFQQLTWKAAITSIGMGILLSLLTPNRTGELAGRLLHIEKSKKLKVLYSNLLCSMSQLQITVLMGLLACMYYADAIETWLKLPSEILLVVAIALFILSVTIYFSSNSLAKILHFFSRKLQKKNTSIQMAISTKLRASLLLYSLLRFFVFSLQFVVLLKLFENSIQIVDAFMFVALLYFSMAIVPSTLLTDLPIRTSLAFFIFEQLGYNGINAMVVTFLIWSVNLVLPALVGFVALPKVNWMSWFKTKQL